ncbi:MAG: trypsin-like peptidase domain-containing protein [Planctomycetaceae bacterium]|nr:trypsin-like peptidase domain-containing protein [Planctomycetaceae bacterium]
MRVVATSLLSAAFASLFTAWLMSPAAYVTAASDVASVSPLESVRPITRRLFDPEGLSPEESINVGVYEAVNRAVVNITAKITQSGRLLPTVLESEGNGSGSIIDHSGRILTNYHVVQDASVIDVTLYNGKTYSAKAVGADPLNDIAIIQIEAPAEELFPVTLGDSRSLRVGMRVFALGNPFGLERTLTTGIISSLDRTLQVRGNWTIRSIIQTDAAINPGSSGGPLLDSHGRLIGINTAIATTTGQSAGVGFAIPVSLVDRVVPQLVRFGKVIRPDLGIAKVFPTDRGLLIAEITPGGPAEKAGLRAAKQSISRRGPFVFTRTDRSTADLIVGVDEIEIKNSDELLSYIDNKRPGDTVAIQLVRDGKSIQVNVRLGGEQIAMP